MQIAFSFVQTGSLLLRVGTRDAKLTVIGEWLCFADRAHFCEGHVAYLVILVIRFMCRHHHRDVCKRQTQVGVSCGLKAEVSSQLVDCTVPLAWHAEYVPSSAIP